MLKKIVLLSSLFTSLAHASEIQYYPTCSVCIVGESDENTTEWFSGQNEGECKRWMKKVAPAYFTRILKRSEVKTVTANDSIRCDELNIYSAFDGFPEMVNLPFEFSQTLATAYESKRVNYTGSSCSLFQKVEELPGLGQKLASAMPGTSFQISANQNVGFTLNIPVIFRAKEMRRMSSKATVVINQGSVSVGYEPCSRAGRSCFADLDAPTSKYCSDAQGVTRKQTCYPERRSLLEGRSLGLNGVWADPK